MNKQPTDTEKLLNWINVNWEMERTAGTQESSVRAEMWHDFYNKVVSGELAPDPIPLPTIKPEDWVYHTKFKAKGQVKRISESGKRAYVIWINGAAPSFVDLKSLEVVSHD